MRELDAKLKDVRIPRANLGPCPVCGHDILENRKGFSCWSREDPGCGFVIWKSKAGKTLPAAVARELIATGRTERPVTGFKGRSGPLVPGAAGAPAGRGRQVARRVRRAVGARGRQAAGGRGGRGHGCGRSRGRGRPGGVDAGPRARLRGARAHIAVRAPGRLLRMRVRRSLLLAVLIVVAVGAAAARSKGAAERRPDDDAAAAELIDPGTAPIDSSLRPPRRRCEGAGRRPESRAHQARAGDRAGLAFDQATGRVLWSRDPQRVLPIASLTKLMTAILVVENTRPRDIVKISPAVPKVEGSRMGYLRPDAPCASRRCCTGC